MYIKYYECRAAQSVAHSLWKEQRVGRRREEEGRKKERGREEREEGRKGGKWEKERLSEGGSKLATGRGLTKVCSEGSTHTSLVPSLQLSLLISLFRTSPVTPHNRQTFLL